MKKVFLLALAAVLMSTGCGDTATTPDKQENAIAKAQFSSTEFSDPGYCDGCHVTIYSQWKGSMHNNAQRDPFYQAMHLQASKDTEGLTDFYCASCHVPIGVMAGEIPPLDGSGLSDTSWEGISCDFCHTVSKAKGIGNAAYVSDPGQLKRGPFKDSHSASHETQFSELHTTSEFCGLCHNVNHPVNNLPLETTYTEWKEGPYAEAGIQCQDCHMTPGSGVTKPNPGQAAIAGPDREHLFTHTIVGANLMGNGILDSEEHKKMAEERLKAAAKLDLNLPARFTPGNSMEVQVKVSNIGAGHYLPTGLTEVRDMWLNLVVTDISGKVVWESGALDEKGNIKEGSVVFKTIVGDKSGKPVHEFWKAEQKLSDKRIPPKGSLTEKYAVTVPAQAKGPLGVKAVLKYRSSSQALIDRYMGAKRFVVPVVEMAAAEGRIR